MKKYIITLLISLMTFVSTAVADQKGANIYLIPRSAPENGVFNQYNKEVKLSDFSGKFVVAVFWSRYCGPCLRELPSLNSLQKKTEFDGIKVILISPSSEWASIDEQKNLLKKYGGGDLDFFIDEKGRLAADFGMFSFPNTVLINIKGQEIGRIKGSATWDDKEIIEYLYKVKAESSAAALKTPEPLMKIDSIKSQELAPVKKN